MADAPITESADAVSNNHTSSSKSPWTASRWLMFATLALAVIAVALAALAYLHPAHTNATGTPQQDGDAKANVCSAFNIVRKAVVVNTHLQSPNDPSGHLSVAANARLALLGGGVYLQQRLAANTAAPTDLASGVDSLAGTVEQLGIDYLAGATPDAVDPLRKDLNAQIDRIAKLCG